MKEILKLLGDTFGVLAESDTTQLRVIAHNKDVAVGDIFILPSKRGHERFYIFRTSAYANIMNRTINLGDVARNKLTMPDSYLSDDLNDEKLIEISGTMLGYAEKNPDGTTWGFFKPRRLPDHLSDVYLVTPKSEHCEVLRRLLASQLGDDGIYVGNFLAGEAALPGVPVHLPPYALSHHIGVFGRTGCGKSNTMMVLIESMFKHNASVEKGGKGQKVSMLAIDPHDEFFDWHKKTGGRGGIAEIVAAYSPEEKKKLVDPFFYLTPKDITDGNGLARVRLSRADVVPDDVISIMEFTEQQGMFVRRVFANNGEDWLGRLLSGDLGDAPEYQDFVEGTKAGAARRVSFLSEGQSKVFTAFDPATGRNYDSLLPQIVCALEKGRIITVDTTLMGEMEQFLLTTTIARVLFMLRKAVKASRGTKDSLIAEIKLALGIDEARGIPGCKALADALVDSLERGELPYLDAAGNPVSLDQLPHINFVIEEAPSVLNPERIRFGSVFRDISRQGRKFQIGLTVVSQQVTAIDEGILTQINTEFTMALGNETERRAAIANASADLTGFGKELQVMSKGQTLVTASYRDVPLPVQAPKYDDL